ncbi:MAG: response regulator [Methanotrichaceae archaeon]
MTDAYSTPDLRILVVDDSAVNRKILLLMLSRLGYTADTATNGKEAIEALERQSYDLVLMDLQMPILDGLRAARIIRENSADKEHPYIIAVTAFASIYDRETCINTGMNDYLTKPVNIKELELAIQSSKLEEKDYLKPRASRHAKSWV